MRLSLKVWRCSVDKKAVEFLRPASTLRAARATGSKYLLGTSIETVQPPPGKHALIVDDDANFRSLFKGCWRRRDFRQLQSWKLKSQPRPSHFAGKTVDVVFCALNLSRLWPRNGIGTVYDIRRICPHLLVYAVTADNTSEVIEKVLQAKDGDRSQWK